SRSVEAEMGRILVVDDDAGIQRALKELLSNRGHTVSSARSGEAALELIEQETHDVVMLGAFDYRMKPFEPGPMLAAIEKALETARLNEAQEDHAHEGAPLDDLIIG